MVGKPFPTDLSSHSIDLAVEDGLGLFLVHQFAVFVGEEGTVRADLQFIDGRIILRGVDMTTLDIVNLNYANILICISSLRGIYMIKVLAISDKDFAERFPMLI